MRVAKFLTKEGKIEWRKYKFHEDWQIEKIAKARGWKVISIMKEW